MRLLFLMLLALSLQACLTSSGKSNTDNASAYELEVNPSRLVMSEIGSSSNMTASLFNQNGESVAGTFTWSSSDESIITVNADGQLVAQAEGKAVITVSYNGVERQAEVIVSLGAIAVNGTVQYQDKLYSTSGVLAQDSYKPVRHAVVDVLNVLGELVMSTSTDDQGHYSFNVLPTDQYLVRVLAKSASGVPFSVEVDDRSGALYGVTQPLDVFVPSSADLVIDHNSGLSAVFNILDVVSIGSEFMQQVQVGTLPPLRVFWEQGKGDATYYCNGFHSLYCLQGAGIYVLSSSTGGDSDEFDDDVLWHEFGHYIAQNFSRDDSPGGCHVLSSTNLDLRLSWSEGWGDFFPSAVKYWLNSDVALQQRLSTPSVSHYIDLSGTWAMIALDVGNAPGSYVDAGNEVAIANVLYQVMGANGMSSVWQVMQSYLPSVSTPVNMEAFWDGWQQFYTPAGQALIDLESIFSSRNIFYQHDSFENDNDTATATPLDLNSVQTHHLYRQDGVGDVDVFQLNLLAGQNYVLKTFDIKNGGDTHLRLFDDLGNQLAENDDAADAPAYVSYDSRCRVSRITNNGNALASKVAFTPTQTGTYYAKVHTTADPVPHPSAGRYGSYSITIQTQ